MSKQEVDDQMNNTTYAVVDLETTGHSPAKGDRMIQIAIVFIKNGEIGEKYVRFVNPGQKIPAFIRQLTAISDEDVADAPHFEEIAAEVAVCWKERFSLRIIPISTCLSCKVSLRDAVLANGLGRKSIRWNCLKSYIPSAPSYRLQDITEELGIPLGFCSSGR